MKVLLLHASLGSGHKRAAQALHEVLEQRGIEADVMDLLDEIPALISGFYSHSYEYMITRNRRLWKFVYETTNRPLHAYRPGKSFWQKWQFSRLKSRILLAQYTHLIATHFTGAALLADWKMAGALHSKIYSVVTDHVAHRCWKRTELDHYFVASENVAHELEAAGISANRILVAGIPVSQTFARPMPRKLAREKWKCGENERVLLLLCSGFDISYTFQLCRDAATLKDCRFLVSAGHGEAKETRIRNEFKGDPRFTVFGFSPLIAEMMSAADLIVTKPGGLIVSEALAMGRPQVLLEPIPGQEEANANFSAQRGAAICLRKGEKLKTALNSILETTGVLQKMTEAALTAGRPNAATEIMDQILNTSTSES